MTTDLEIITSHLRGSCVTIENRIHGLFKLTSRDRAAADSAWSQVRPEPQHQAPVIKSSQTAAQTMLKR